PFELAAELLIVLHRRAQLAAALLDLVPERLERPPRLLPLAADLGLRRLDQVLGVAAGIERRLELGELAHQVLQVMLVGIGLLELAEADRADLALPLRRLAGPRLGGAELLGGLL